MKAIVIYESMTGNTRRAAAMIAAKLGAAGHSVLAVCPTTAVDLDALSAADTVLVGTWTDGVFVFGQRPAAGGRLETLPAMAGKRAVAFCTYALDAGRTVEKLMAILERRGAEVIGGMAIKRSKLDEHTSDFVDRLVAAVAA